MSNSFQNVIIFLTSKQDVGFLTFLLSNILREYVNSHHFIDGGTNSNFQVVNLLIFR